MTTKRCPRCTTVKPVEEFGVSWQTRDGRAGWCLKCTGVYKREWRRLHRDRIRTYNRLYGRIRRARLKASRAVI